MHARRGSWKLGGVEKGPRFSTKCDPFPKETSKNSQTTGKKGNSKIYKDLGASRRGNLTLSRWGEAPLPLICLPTFLLTRSAHSG
jgi:hypothetical protein